MLLLSSTDIIFNLGEEPAEPKMYIVVSGQLEYMDSYGEVAQVTCLSVFAIAWKEMSQLQYCRHVLYVGACHAHVVSC